MLIKVVSLFGEWPKHGFCMVSVSASLVYIMNLEGCVEGAVTPACGTCVCNPRCRYRIAQGFLMLVVFSQAMDNVENIRMKC